MDAAELRARVRQEADELGPEPPGLVSAGASIIGLDDDAAWALVRAAALDSIPALRRRVLDRLLARPGLRPTTRTLADALDLDKRPTERVLQDCTALGITAKTTEDTPGHTKVEHWFITERARELAHQAGLTLGLAAITSLEEPPEASTPTLVLDEGDERDPLDAVDRELGIGPYRRKPQ
jgi:hypothetical protein